MDCFNSSMVTRESIQFPLFSGRHGFNIFEFAAKFLFSRSEIKPEPKGLTTKLWPNFLSIYFKESQDY